MLIQREIQNIIDGGPARVAAIQSRADLSAILHEIDNVAIFAENDAIVAQRSPDIRSVDNHVALTRLRLEALRKAGQVFLAGDMPEGLGDEISARATSLAVMEEDAFEAEIQNASKVETV